MKTKLHPSTFLDTYVLKVPIQTVNVLRNAKYDSFSKKEKKRKFIHKMRAYSTKNRM